MKKPLARKTTTCKLVLVTVPDRKTARKIARKLLNEKAAACVGIIPKMESLYWWKGRIEKSSEHLLLIKTSANKLPLAQALVVKDHPYDVPEFIFLPIEGGSAPYLQWLAESIH
jgi:periplasmic divalent cation tolerance protein